MGYAAVIEFPRNFSQCVFAFYYFLFGPFDALKNDEIFDGRKRGFRKNIGNISITVIEFPGNIGGYF